MNRAPRYSRPIPDSRLPPPPGRPVDVSAALSALIYQIGLSLRLDRAVVALSDAIDRERGDYMGRVGFVLGGVACAAVVIVSAATN